MQFLFLFDKKKIREENCGERDLINYALLLQYKNHTQEDDLQREKKGSYNTQKTRKETKIDRKRKKILQFLQEIQFLLFEKKMRIQTKILIK